MDVLRRVRQSFEPLFGQPCWNARHGYGSFLTFEFGEPHLEIHEPRVPNPASSPSVQRRIARRQVFVHGEWHLWIYCCDWLVTANGERVGESGTVRRMEAAAAELDGQALVAVTADLERGRWYFDFDLGGRLETRTYSARSPYFDSANKQWHLYEPTGYVLTVRADGSYSHQPGSTPRKDERWIPPTGEGSTRPAG